MPGWPEWERIFVDLGIGAAAGLVGGIAREARMVRTDRELNWLLIPRLIGSCAIGSLAMSVASSAGVENLHALVTCSIAAGLLGVAAITDLVRGFVRERLPPPPDRRKDSAS